LYECFSCNQFFKDFIPQYSFQARFSDFSAEIAIHFYRQFGEAVMGFPASKFVVEKEKS
jgi:hypothetical protein